MDMEYTNSLHVIEQYDPEKRYGKAMGLSDVAVLSLRVAERASLISCDILLAIQQGESCDTIVRKIEGLHEYLISLTENSNRALYVHGFYLNIESGK